MSQTDGRVSNARLARLPHARRMGAARGDLDRLAAQPRGLARQVRANPLGLHRDRPPAQPCRDGPHRGPRRGHEATGGRPARRRRGRPGPGPVLQGRDGPRLAPRLGSDVRGQGRPVGPGERARRPGRLEVQRLGQVRQLPRRQPPPAQVFEVAGTAAMGSAGRAGGASRPGRDGRGRDRRQRPRHAADDRGMPARRGPGPQPRPRPRRPSRQILADYLGIRHVIWLGRGIDGDDTHGHVDDLARFVDPTTVVTVVEPRLRRPQPRAAAGEPPPPSRRPRPGRTNPSASSSCPCPAP